MGCFEKMAKFILIIFNFVFVLCGLALVIIGGLLWTNAVDISDVIDEIDTGLKAPPVIFIIIGTFIFVIAFFGCFGAWRESKCMLITFSACLIVIFIIQVVIGVYAVVTFDENDTKKILNDIFIKRNEVNIEMFDTLQESLECCGVSAYTDYGIRGWSVPSSCCPQNVCNSPSDYFQVGCAKALNDWVLSSGKILGGVALGLSVVEIIGIVLAFVLSRQVNYSI